MSAPPLDWTEGEDRAMAEYRGETKYARRSEEDNGPDMVSVSLPSLDVAMVLLKGFVECGHYDDARRLLKAVIRHRER